MNVDVPPSALLATPVANNWPSYNGDYTGRRFSGLTQITTANVQDLRVQWVFHSRNSAAMEVTPVVFSGVMYLTSGNDAFALDARTGRVIWHHAHPLSSGLIDDAASHHNRGVAIWHTRVYMETDNAHLLCLDARSGNLLWDIAYADTRLNYGATSAPLIVHGKVIVGTSGGDDGVRGFLAAFDTVSGKELWRFWTIPKPGEPNSSSWNDQTYLTGGGTTWMPGTFDPETGTLFWGVGNPDPDFDGSNRPGDDLYTDSVLALDPDSGHLKWYFQFTPHDVFDYDATETPVLVDATTNRGKQHLLVEANRNGFFYVLDRNNGKFLRAVPFSQNLNWAKSIDGNGRPIRSGIKPTPGGVSICPGIVGATNWFSPSYNPVTHIFYFLALESCDIYTSRVQTEVYEPGHEYYSTGTRRNPAVRRQKRLLAIHVPDAKLLWAYPQVGEGRSSAGTMTTSTGLVFFGDDAGEFEAIGGKTGTPFWHFNTGQTIVASPMTFAVGGVQYVAIAAGSDLFCFALPVEDRSRKMAPAQLSKR
ncbi:MAG: PQQ-binding-like beta-propeller repeat protein [Terriglobia bacterium]